MRMKREIAKLNVEGAKMTLPLANHPFDRYRWGLKAVLLENCGRPIADTLDYCEYDQRFTVELKVAAMPADCHDSLKACDDFRMELSKVFVIDPLDDLEPQIDELLELRAHLHQSHAQMSVLLSLYREGYKMVEDRIPE